jgi:hypothetical protein
MRVANYNDTRCWDCKVETNHLSTSVAEWYMVWDWVWKLAGGDSVDFLCIGCLESRLGRELVPGDFSCVPLNSLSGYSRSLRLRTRMGIDYE